MDATPIRTGRLYDDLAYLWPIISPPEEYIEEAAHWRSLLREKLGAGRRRILELGVGGGHNLSHLTSDFDATAVDLSEKMLDLSRRLNPEVKHVIGDMRSARLGRTFDAVLIHDAISCLTTEDDLRATFATAAAHLEPGGILIISPDQYAGTFSAPRIDHCTRSTEELEVTFIEYAHDPDPNDTAIEIIMFFLICEREGLRIEIDRHLAGLFPKETWLNLMQRAGFSTAERTMRIDRTRETHSLLLGDLIKGET